MKAFTWGPEDFGMKQSGTDDGFPASAQVEDPFPKTYYSKYKLEPLPLGPKSLEVLANLLLDSVDFATVVSQISTDVTGLGYHFVGKRGAPPEVVKRETEEAQEFFGNCNPDDTFHDISGMSNSDWEALGNGYVEVTREGNKPDGKAKRLDWIPGTECRITTNEKMVMQMRDRAKAWFRRYGTNPDEYRHPETNGVLHEVIWLKHPHPRSRVYGIPKIIPAIGAVRGNIYQQDRNLAFFLNRTWPDYRCVVSGELIGTGVEEDEKEVEKFRENIKNHMKYILRGESYRLLYLEIPPGITVEFEQMTGDYKDADFMKWRRDNRDDTLRSYSMSPNRVGVIESGNIGGGTGESQIEIYKHSVVKPRQEKWEKKWDRFLVSGLFLTHINFKLDEIDSIDEEREANILGRIGVLPFMTINDGRAYISKFLKMTLDPIPEPWADIPFPVLAAQTASIDLGLMGGDQQAAAEKIMKLIMPPKAMNMIEDGEKIQQVYDQIRATLGVLNAE